jgi:anti-sigma factor RsiW
VTVHRVLPDHGGFRELVAGRALGDLEPGECEAVDQHLDACPACRALERDLELVMADLALASAPRRPPPALHAAVMAAIGRSAKP